jgi:hypothetical protein
MFCVIPSHERPPYVIFIDVLFIDNIVIDIYLSKTFSSKNDKHGKIAVSFELRTYHDLKIHKSPLFD